MRGLHVTFFAPLGLFILATGALVVSAGRRSLGGGPGSQLVLRIALCASLALIFVVTLHPADGANDHQLVPLIRIVRGFRPPIDSGVVANTVGNVLLFLPLGAALGLLGLRRRSATLAGFGLSAAIEVAQLFIPGRTTSADDVLCNTLGALVGCLLVSRLAATRRAA